MAEFKIEIKNLAQIKAAFHKAPMLMADNLNKAIQRSLFQIQRDSMSATPVDTGRLRASHTTRFGALRGELEPTANYAFFVHDGTRYMRGRPFLLNAVKKNDSEVQGNFTKAVQDTLDKIGDMT